MSYAAPFPKPDPFASHEISRDVSAPAPPAEISFAHSQGQISTGVPEMSFQKNGDPVRPAMTHGDLQARRVAEALRLAFPEATSETDLAERASTYFRKDDGSAVEPRTIRYWLRGTSLPSNLHMMTLICMVGADFFHLPRRGYRA